MPSRTRVSTQKTSTISARSKPPALRPLTEFIEIYNSVDPVLVAVITTPTGETGESSTSSTIS